MQEEQYELNEESNKAEKLPVRESSILATIEDVPAGTIKSALVKINVTDEQLTELTAKVNNHLATIKGLPTKEQYEATKRLRLDIRPIRIAIEKAAKEGREDALKVQRLWLAAEKAATSPFSALEEALSVLEGRHEAELKRVAEEKVEVERKRVAVLYDQLKAYDWPGNEIICAQYTPEEFTSELAKSKTNWEAIQAGKRAEAERLEREAKDRAEQEERNRAEAERLREVEEKQRAEQARLDAERAAALKEVEEAKAKALKEIEDAKARDEAERVKAQVEANRKEQERLAEERRVMEVEKAAEEKRVREAEEIRRLSALAPDKDKIGHFVEMISSALVSHEPGLEDHELSDRFDLLVEDMRYTLERIKALT